ncbi:MAG TPA: cation:proton antiporter, partial [bacterium]|nr:cation:proton antiporter [bacterium]
IMPNETGFVRHLSEKIEDIAVLFLLPLFFAYTGLRTQVGLLDTPELWGLAGLILLVACLGKFGGSFGAAKLMGVGLRESAAIGILMNTRGLMELVIISIGLDLGVISPALFTMLVLMALVTTFTTSPLLHWVYPTERFHGVVEVPLEKEKPYTILVSIALLRAGGGLLKIARALAGGDSSRLYALHLVKTSERPSYYVKGSDAMEEYSQLAPLLEPFRHSGLDLRPLSFPTNDPAEDIVEVARTKAADLVLLGWHKPILGQTVLGGTVHEVMENSRTTVAVFIDRGLQRIGRILVPYISSSHDRAALALAQRMARFLHSEVVILHVMQPQHAVDDPHAMVKSFDEDFIDPDTESQVKLEVIESLSPIEAVLEESKNGYDLVVIGVSEDFDLEHRLFGLRPERIAAECPVSMLIVRQAPNGANGKA